MSKENNIPAFPLSGVFDQLDSDLPVQGMSLRDYFAAKAMQAGMSIPVRSEPEEFEAACYAMEDAMLAERNKC